MLSLDGRFGAYLNGRETDGKQKRNKGKKRSYIFFPDLEKIMKVLKFEAYPSIYKRLILIDEQIQEF